MTQRTDQAHLHVWFPFFLACPSPFAPAARALANLRACMATPATSLLLHAHLSYTRSPPNCPDQRTRPCTSSFSFRHIIFTSLHGFLPSPRAQLAFLLSPMHAIIISSLTMPKPRFFPACILFCPTPTAFAAHQAIFTPHLQRDQTCAHIIQL